MSLFTSQTSTINGIATKALVGGSDSLPVTLFLQSNVPGVTPYCAGKHLWGSVLDTFARHRRVIALDTLGCGETGQSDSVPTIDAIANHVIGYLDSHKLSHVHLVGHDVAGMVALAIAIDRPELLASVSVVSSSWAAPSGDGVDNLTLLAPPEPLWSASSQFWALDRLSYSHHHIDPSLVEASTSAATRSAHRGALLAMAGEGYSTTFLGNALKAKFRLFGVAREKGLRVPVQIICGNKDPLAGVEHSKWLFQIIGQRQPATQLHVLNRCGSFPFREQPEEFHRVVTAFQDGLLLAA